MSIADWLELKLLDKVFNNTDFTVTTPYVSLHDGDPGEDGSNEITAGDNSYARQAASFGAAASGAVSTDAALEWTDMPAVTVSHVGVWDAATDGNFLWGGALAASKATNAGDTFSIASGSLTATLD